MPPRKKTKKSVREMLATSRLSSRRPRNNKFTKWCLLLLLQLLLLLLLLLFLLLLLLLLLLLFLLLLLLLLLRTLPHLNLPRSA